MTNVYLMRHFESVAQLSPELICGRSNAVRLSKEGKRQAKRAKRYMALRAIDPDHVYASPSARTVKSARLLFDGEKQIIVDDRLQEMSQGEAEGKNRAEVYSPEDLAALSAKPDFTATGGESLEGVAERMRAVVTEAAANSESNQSILVISHKMAIRALLADILHYAPDSLYRMEIDNGSLSCIGVLPCGMYVDNINTSTQNISL